MSDHSSTKHDASLVADITVLTDVDLNRTVFEGPWQTFETNRAHIAQEVSVHEDSAY